MTYLTQRFLHKPELRSQFLNLVLINLVLITLLATCPGNVMAQSNTFPPSGNAGIGTTSPTQPLDVAGNIVTTGSQSFTADNKGVIEVTNTITNSASSSSSFRARNTFSGSGNNPMGIDIFPTFAPTQNISLARGFVTGGRPAPPANVTIDKVYGGNFVILYDNTAGAVTTGTTTLVDSPIVFGALKPTTQYGLRILNQGIANTTNSYGLYVDNQSGSNNNYSAIFAGGNVGIGTTTPTERLVVNGNISLTGTINARYQDVAEWVPASEHISTGTVVVLDSTKSNHVIASTRGYDTRVAGVISAQPGISLGESGNGKVLVATTGRVRIKVDATRSPIQVGDLLVTSDVPGLAMKSEPLNVGGVQLHRPGTLIGKALEPLATGQGAILVLLSLQ